MEEEIELKTVMIAAAEEIMSFWPAHCDSDGYGPANLLRRLEKGIASRYAYSAGDFEKLHAEVDRLEAEIEQLKKNQRT